MEGKRMGNEEGWRIRKKEGGMEGRGMENGKGEAGMEGRGGGRE